LIQVGKLKFENYLKSETNGLQTNTKFHYNLSFLNF
jgi:hypothetical protein